MPRAVDENINDMSVQIKLLGRGPDPSKMHFRFSNWGPILFCCFLPKPRVLNPNLCFPTRSACTLKVKRRPSWISRSPHRMGIVCRRKSYDTCFLGLFRSLTWFLAFILPFKWVSRSNGGHLGFQGHLIEWEPFIVESPMIHVFWVSLGRWIDFWHSLLPFKWVSRSNGGHLGFQGHLIEWEPFIVESPMIHVFWVFLGRWIDFWHSFYHLNEFQGQTAAILDFKVTSQKGNRSS